MSKSRLREYDSDIKFRLRGAHKRQMIHLAMRRDTDISDVAREAIAFYLEHEDSPAKHFQHLEPAHA